MDTIIIVFRDYPHSLLCHAVCLEADDRAGALAIYASLKVEQHPSHQRTGIPLVYLARVVEPERLTKPLSLAGLLAGARSVGG
jgi:hypothetical protein